MPVPPGFVVTADAYLAAVEQAGIRDELRRLAHPRSDIPPDDDVAARASAAQQLLSGLEVPHDLVTALTTAVHQLGGGWLAVRSSAAGEDSAAASFAGMNRTLTNVAGDDALCRAVEACWRSLWGERVVAYRARQGFDAEPAMAVVVQQMLDVTAAGVLFTRDPSGREPETIVIEAAFGQGEVVVGGLVEPDHFLVDRLPGGGVGLRQVRVGRKNFEIVRGPDGTETRVQLSRGARTGPCALRRAGPAIGAPGPRRGGPLRAAPGRGVGAGAGPLLARAVAADHHVGFGPAPRNAGAGYRSVEWFRHDRRAGGARRRPVGLLRRRQRTRPHPPVDQGRRSPAGGRRAGEHHDHAGLVAPAPTGRRHRDRRRWRHLPCGHRQPRARDPLRRGDPGCDLDAA